MSLRVRRILAAISVVVAISGLLLIVEGLNQERDVSQKVDSWVASNQCPGPSYGPPCHPPEGWDEEYIQAIQEVTVGVILLATAVALVTVAIAVAVEDWRRRPDHPRNSAGGAEADSAFVSTEVELPTRRP